VPAGGGSFLYDLAIADTTPVSGLIDAWVEVILPVSDTLEILSRQDLSIQPGDTMLRVNVQQFVPPGAPAGIYTYTVYAGNLEYNSPWGQDSFTFEKLGGGGNTPALRLGDSAWTLQGWGDSSVGAQRTAPLQPGNLQLIIGPNPFNLATTISFMIPDTGIAQLTIYDEQGRQIAKLLDAQLVSGSHTVVWKADQHPSGIYIVHLKTEGGDVAKKILLLK
jgi:hypothetical protein